MARFAGLGTGIGIAGAAYAAASNGLRPRLTRHTLAVDGGPGIRGLRVAALADLHANEAEIGEAALDEIVARTNALSPDLVLLLGDYCSQDPGALPVERVAARLARLRARLGVFGVQGNHDWLDDPAAMRRGRGPNRTADAFASEGLRLLDDQALEVAPGLWLAGLGSEYAPGKGGRPLYGDALDAARVATLSHILAPAAPRADVLLMAHEPDIFAAPIDARVRAVFSGHTHGGQVRVLGWSPWIPSRYGMRYAYGHVAEAGRHLVVSGGLGSHFVAGRPLRVGMPPEIVLAEIRGGAST